MNETILVNTGKNRDINTSILNERYVEMFSTDWLSPDQNGIVAIPKNDDNLSLDNGLFYIESKEVVDSVIMFSSEHYICIQTPNEIRFRVPEDALNKKYKLIIIWK